MLETEVSIVFAIIAEFRSNITDINSFEWMMSFKAANLSNDRLNSIVIFINDQSCEYNGMSCSNAKATWPELGCFD